MTKHMRIALAALLAGLLLPSAAWAQFGFPPGGAIMGTGTAVLKRPPTTVRMYLMLVGRGKTAAEAVAVLKARRQAATAELVKLGADQKSIQSSSISVSSAESQRRRQLQSMIRQRMQARGATAKPVKLPEIVSVAVMLTAEWPVAAKDPEELFLMSHELQAKVKAAKLGTGKEGDKLSPEEEEVAEEMKAEMGPSFGPSGEEEFDLNTPLFSYVAKITEEERAKITAEAFAKARADAQRIAQAAGVQLGPLAGLFDDASVRGGYYGPSYYNEGPVSSTYRQMIERFRTAAQRERVPDEAVSDDPGQVTFSVTARVMFALGKEE